MTREQWERLKVLFNGALEQQADARPAWIAREAGGDRDLMREATALLAAHDTVADFLETPAVIDPADIVGPPEGGPHAEEVEAGPSEARSAKADPALRSSESEG